LKERRTERDRDGEEEEIRSKQTRKREGGVEGKMNGRKKQLNLFLLHTGPSVC
jgi:hypothetical protein